MWDLWQNECLSGSVTEQPTSLNLCKICAAHKNLLKILKRYQQKLRSNQVIFTRLGSFDSGSVSATALFGVGQRADNANVCFSNA